TGGRPNTPTEPSRSDWMSLGKKPVMKLPCMYMKQPGLGLLNIALPAVPKLLLSIARRPPSTLPSVNATVWNSCAAGRVRGRSNLSWCEIHWLYESMPPYLRTRFSNQSVAGQPVAVPDSTPRHQGTLPSPRILSVSAFSSSIVLGIVYPAASNAFFG